MVSKAASLMGSEAVSRLMVPGGGAAIGGAEDAAMTALRAEVRRRVGDERYARYFGEPQSLRVVEGGERAGAGGERAAAELIVTMPSPMMAALVRKHMRAELEEAFRAQSRRTDAQVRFEVRGQLTMASPSAESVVHRGVTVQPDSAVAGSIGKAQAGREAAGREVARRMARVARGPAGLPLGLRYRLGDMVVGAGNRLAHGAATSMALEAGRGVEAVEGEHASAGRCAVLYVHGRCGVGKTHLLQGAAAEAFAAQAGRAVRYVSAEGFATEFITAVRNKSMDAFRRTYRYLDLLCIDDLGVLSGKPATQAELQATLDAVVSRRGRVMAAGPDHPRMCVGLSEGLRSRLSAGLVAEMGAADEEMAERVVVAMAGRRGLALEAGAARALVRRVAELSARERAASEATARDPGTGAEFAPGCVSVRELEGAVTKVEAVHRLLGEGAGKGPGRIGGSVGLVCVERALRVPASSAATGVASASAPLSVQGKGVDGVMAATVATGGARMVRMDQIVEEVCRALGVSREEVSARGRHVRVVLARALSTHLARRLTTLSYPEIARALGRPNHSTVITAAQRLEGQLAVNPVVPLGPGRGEEPLVALRDRLLGSVSGGRWAVV